MMYSSGMPDYSSVMRNTVVTTTEMLELIEQDLAESRLLIRARNNDDEIAMQLVASLQEDNGLLRSRVETLEADLAYMHEYSAQSNETLFKEFEEKILACNGEIERVISQCNDAISDRDDFETQLRQMEVTCAVYSEELEQAKLRLSQSTAHDDNLSRENAHLKEELLRMAHNQYSLQEQLAQITASNAATQNNSISANNHAELTSLRGPQSNSGTSTGTSNLYEDEDIAALLQRVKQLEEQNRLLSKQTSNSLAPTSPHARSSVYKEPVPVLPTTSLSIPLSPVQLSPQLLTQVQHSPRLLPAPQASPGFSHPIQGNHSSAPPVQNDHLQYTQAGFVTSPNSAHSQTMSKQAAYNVSGQRAQSSGAAVSSCEYSSHDDSVRFEQYPVERINSAEQIPQQVYLSQQLQQPQQQPQQLQQQQLSVSQQYNTSVQQTFSPQPNHVPADSVHSTHPYMHTSPQQYAQLVHQTTASPAVSPKHHVAVQHYTTYTTTNPNPVSHSPAHFPRQLPLNPTSYMTSPQNTNMSHAYGTNATNHPTNNYSNTTTSSGMFERQLASPESDGGNPFELDDSYVQNNSFHYNNLSHHGHHSATHPTLATDNTAFHDHVTQAQQNRVRFGPPEYLREEVNPTHFASSDAEDANSNNPDMSDPSEPLHVHVNGERGEDRIRDLSAEYNDLYNAELYDIIAYSESQLSASQRNIRQRSPQRFYEESHLTGRQTRTENAYSSTQSRSGDSLSNLSYVSESEDSGDRTTTNNPTSVAVHTNDTNYTINTTTTTDTLTNSTNDADNDYPDDFESYTYEDDMSGYLDDQRTGTEMNSAGADRLNRNEDQSNAMYQGEDSHNNEEDCYNNTYNAYAGNDNDGQDRSRSDSVEDTGFDNVFMYDGSSASALAPVEYDPSMHDDYFNGTIGLDELSRLSL